MKLIFVSNFIKFNINEGINEKWINSKKENKYINNNQKYINFNFAVFTCMSSAVELEF